MILIVELSTNHGGSVDLAADMIRAAADAGADFAKIQTYDLAKLNPADPQAAWLRQAHLNRDAHVQLMQVAKDAGIGFLSTPFDVDSLQMLRKLGLKTFKIASSESGHNWWAPLSGEQWFVSYPWGVVATKTMWHLGEPIMVPRYSLEHTRLTAIPLYPTPVEAVSRVTLLDGWSDHTIGLSACQWAIAHGVTVIEAHFRLEGRGRQCAWDKSPEQFKTLRAFADDCETMRQGVSTQFRERWNR